MDSGSGSGSGTGPPIIDVTKDTTVTTTTTTTMKMAKTTDHPLTDCEYKRQSSQSLVGKYVPRCLPNGDYDSLQCHGYPGTSECWCSDLLGREIPGTLMEAPNYPSCDDGNNLPPCVHQLVKSSRSKLLGSFEPLCAVDGQFKQVQCHALMCFCVHESTGKRIPGSEVHKPDRPKCDGDSEVAEVTTRKIMPTKDNSEIYFVSTDQTERTIHPGGGNNNNLGVSDKNENEKIPKVTNKSGDKEVMLKPPHDGHYDDKVEKASEIMTQPGILAGIIGGSVVLLLCLVLLVMFVVYRMRKKDEGSYPLDEPRKTPNYNYVRAPEKEFYA